jgi:trk system potassium uptake protein TrkH
MRAESPGPSVGKLVPKIKSSAQILYLIYVGMTGIQIILLLATGMPLFHTLCMTFGSAGTGGFGILNDSAASYTAIQQWIIAVFIMLFGINFNFYYFILHKQPKKSLQIEEVRWYIGIILASSLIIFSQIYHSVGNVERAARQSFFQVSSIITTTGFSTVDFNQWSSLAKMILVTLMFCGACAGSTGGGLKVSRIVILLKSIHKEIRSYMHPKCVKKIKVDGEVLDHDVLRATNVFLVTYFLIFVASLFIVCLDDKDLITSFTAVAATMNNIGPGLEKVGPAANFSEFSNLSKMVLSFDMLAGRLELFPMIMLFHPILWRDTIIAKIRHHSKAA